MRPLMRDDVGGKTEEVFRQKMITASEADKGSIRALRCVAGNIAA